MITTALSRATNTPHGGIERRLDPHSNTFVNTLSSKEMNEVRMAKQQFEIAAAVRWLVVAVHVPRPLQYFEHLLYGHLVSDIEVRLW